MDWIHEIFIAAEKYEAEGRKWYAFESWTFFEIKNLHTGHRYRGNFQWSRSVSEPSGRVKLYEMYDFEKQTWSKQSLFLDEKKVDFERLTAASVELIKQSIAPKFLAPLKELTKQVIEREKERIKKDHISYENEMLARINSL